MAVGLYKTEISADQPIREVATGITATLVEAERGIPGYPKQSIAFAKYQQEFGSYNENMYSPYCVRAAYNNGSSVLFPVRVVGEDARCAGGGYGYKVDPLSAEITHGSGDSELSLVADSSGPDGADLTLEIVDNDSDVSEVSLSGDDILVERADTTAVKRSAQVLKLLLNGHSVYVWPDGGSGGDGSSIVFYSTQVGSIGDNYSVEVVDSGGVGGLDVTLSADGLTLTIDLDGDTPTAATVVSAVNAVSGSTIEALEGDGTGADAVSDTLTETSLAGGQSSTAAVATASSGGAGDVTTLAKTHLEGKGSVTSGTYTISNQSTLNTLTAVTNKVLPGDYLVVYTGPDKGAYEITEVGGENELTVDALGVSSWAGWSATQDDVIFSIMGYDGADYSTIVGWTNSPGDSGDDIVTTIEKNPNDTLNAQVVATDSDGVERIIESYQYKSADPTDPEYLEDTFSADSRWMNVTIRVREVTASGTDGATNGDNQFTSASATFLLDAEVGDYLVITDSTDSDNIKVYPITEVVGNNTMNLGQNFGTAPSSSMDYDVVSVVETEAALLNVVDDSIEITMAGGVYDVPLKSDYEGNETAKTGVHAITKIPKQLTPNKFFVPESPVVVDSEGADATEDLDKAMLTFVEAEGRQNMVYFFYAEQGLTPSTLTTAIENLGIDSWYASMWWPWGYMSDPLSGTTKLVPLTGHIVGAVDKVDKTRGLHKALGNHRLVDIVDGPSDETLEYNPITEEVSLISEYNVNCVVDDGGPMAYGDYILTNNSKQRFLHKRLVAIKLIESIARTLRNWAIWEVQHPDTWATILMMVDSFLSKYDGRQGEGRNSHLVNSDDFSAQPWFAECNFANNDLGSSEVNLDMGFDVVETIERVNVTYGIDRKNNTLTVTER